MSYDNVVKGNYLLMKKGATLSHATNEYQVFMSQYVKQHQDEFNKLPDLGPSYKKFYDKQDKEYKMHCFKVFVGLESMLT